MVQSSWGGLQLQRLLCGCHRQETCPYAAAGELSCEGRWACSVLCRQKEPRRNTQNGKSNKNCMQIHASSQHLSRDFQTISFQKNILSNSSCPASFSALLLCFLKKLLGAQPFNKKCQFWFDPTYESFVRASSSSGDQSPVHISPYIHIIYSPVSYIFQYERGLCRTRLLVCIPAVKMKQQLSFRKVASPLLSILITVS